MVAPQVPSKKVPPRSRMRAPERYMEPLQAVLQVKRLTVAEAKQKTHRQRCQYVLCHRLILLTQHFEANVRISQHLIQRFF